MQEAAQHRREVEHLQKQLEEARVAAQSPQHQDPESPLNTHLESNSETGMDWREVELELTHLRKHHQKTLHEFRSLEQHCTQLQKELQSLKHSSPDTTNLTLISELFSSSILSPPYSRSQSRSQTSMSGKLHHSSSLPHLHLFSSTPGTNLGMRIEGMGSYLSPDSSETPTTLTSEKETLVFSEMKQKILELEHERDSMRRVKEALEEKMDSSGGEECDGGGSVSVGHSEMHSCMYGSFSVLYSSHFLTTLAHATCWLPASQLAMRPPSSL